MPLKLPPEGHPVRLLVDVAEIEAMTIEQVLKLPSVDDAKRMARDRFKETPASLMAMHEPNLYNALILSTHRPGKIMLISIGPRGGWKVRWCFGSPDALMTERVK